MVEKTIASLKKRLWENNDVIEIYGGDGYLYKTTCSFYEGTTEESISNFEKRWNVAVPADYREFLQLTNGCRLFDDCYGGGETEMYSIENIQNYRYEDAYEGCYTIGYTYQDQIVIHSERYKQGNPHYIMVKGHLDQFHEARCLHMNFEQWLDRFIMSQGNKFWDWWAPTETAYKK
ncbi:SMI1/KNR4 family protein [Priestia megaterium]|nr:SMI1/KNR4 family protein [Priestia megaterium]